MSRRPLIAGNWKMNLTVPEADDLIRKLVGNLPTDLHQRVDVAVLPPFPLLAAVKAVLSTEDPFVMIGGQDLSPHDKGAHTGDVSGPMLCSVGCRYVAVGHSERRTDHARTTRWWGPRSRPRCGTASRRSCAWGRGSTSGRPATRSSTRSPRSTRRWTGCRRTTPPES